MLPIVTPAAMRAFDDATTTPVETLIERSGAAVANAALRMMGGAYGRRVVVLAGRGNNGNDARAAARILQRRGAQVRVFDVGEQPDELPPCDLVVDGALGTGFHGSWSAPDHGGAQVLAIDIPSGVDGLTGQAGDGVMAADRTVVLAALKPGNVFAPGSHLCGEIEIADIGLPCISSCNLVTSADVREWWRPRASDSHKWKASTRVVAGSPGMSGSAHLASMAALRAGSGMVHLSTPGPITDAAPHEYVRRPVPAARWAGDVLAGLDRFQALAIGPGLGREDDTVECVRDVLAACSIPAVVDGDALFALSSSNDGIAALLRGRSAATVLTPHDGEFATLAGEAPGVDRVASARRLAAALGVVVLLKGAATVVAEPGGDALVVTAGDDRLATAGTGDVLTGIIAAMVANGLPAFHAAAAGAWLHGRAARSGHRHGLIASDLLELIPAVLDSLS